MENANELRRLLVADKREDYDFTTYIKSNEAAVDFVMDRYRMYDVYETRLGLSKTVTHEHYEGLEEAVSALKTTHFAKVRLLEFEFYEEIAVAFTDESGRFLLGCIFLPRMTD
ncbi:MAG TPA: hypothetical protein VF598_14905 [Hymenobacter sp.]|jgi:hypothetical protein